MSAAEIAAALGGARREGQNWRCRCPLHGGCSLALRDGRSGLLVHCWAGCDARDILAELRDRGLIDCVSGTANLERKVDTSQKRGGPERAEVERLRRGIARARELYRRAAPPEGTPVVNYLGTRGIFEPIPPALRFLDSCPHRNGCYYPAMVAPIVNVWGEQIAIHKTFLRPDGSGKAELPKHEQRETCGPMKGGAVRLASHCEGKILLTEGIESALSAMHLFNLPGWAAISAGGIEALELPAAIRLVVVAADNDENFVGQQAAAAAFERWRGEGRQVRILLSPNAGEDFNDVLLARSQ